MMRLSVLLRETISYAAGENMFVEYVVHGIPSDTRKHDEFGRHERERADDEHEYDELMLLPPDAIMREMKNHRGGGDEKDHDAGNENEGYERSH